MSVPQLGDALITTGMGVRRQCTTARARVRSRKRSPGGSGAIAAMLARTLAIYWRPIDLLGPDRRREQVELTHMVKGSLLRRAGTLLIIHRSYERDLREFVESAPVGGEEPERTTSNASSWSPRRIDAKAILRLAIESTSPRKVDFLKATNLLSA